MFRFFLMVSRAAACPRRQLDIVTACERTSPRRKHSSTIEPQCTVLITIHSSRWTERLIWQSAAKPRGSRWLIATPSGTQQKLARCAQDTRCKLSCGVGVHDGRVRLGRIGETFLLADRWPSFVPLTVKAAWYILCWV